MAVLVLAEHDNSELKPATLNTVAAAIEIGGEIDVLVAGTDCASVGEAASKISGIKRVLVADDPALAQQLAEDVAPLIVRLASDYSHVLAPADTFGKNILPRAAALLDVQQISDIQGVESPDTFQPL